MKGFKYGVKILICMLLVGLMLPLQQQTSTELAAFSQSAVKVDWITFNKAESAYKSKKYNEALPLFEKVKPSFIVKADQVNLANLYSRLGRCYAETKAYDKAEAAWRQEAICWNKAGKRQETIAATRKADLIQASIRLFTKVPLKDLPSLDHGAKFEPKAGAYLGIYAENDSVLWTSDKPDALYTGGVPIVLGKSHPVYLIYTDYEHSILNYTSHYRAIANAGGMVELGIQPREGIENVKDDARLTEFAKEVGAMGVPVLLRFANEMNDPTSSWYFDNPSVYIEKFRLVANKVHQYAPNAAMLWAPAYFPPDNITKYYPGDAYVDWVGVSMYRQYHPELDPLGQGVDRFRFVDQFQNIYNLYADKKPIMVSEGAVSYTDKNSRKDITPFAARELSDYLAYMPMLYPKLKGITYFDTSVGSKGTSYRLTDNSVILDVYKNGIQDPFYLSTLNASAESAYKEIQGSVPVLPASAQTLSAYVKSPEQAVAKVVYTVEGVSQTALSTPYTVSVDFSKYKGKRITVKTEVYDKSGKLLVGKTSQIMIK